MAVVLVADIDVTLQSSHFVPQHPEVSQPVVTSQAHLCGAQRKSTAVKYVHIVCFFSHTRDCRRCSMDWPSRTTTSSTRSSTATLPRCVRPSSRSVMPCHVMPFGSVGSRGVRRAQMVKMTMTCCPPAGNRDRQTAKKSIKTGLYLLHHSSSSSASCHMCVLKRIGILSVAPYSLTHFWQTCYCCVSTLHLGLDGWLPGPAHACCPTKK